MIAKDQTIDDRHLRKRKCPLSGKPTNEANAPLIYAAINAICCDDGPAVDVPMIIRYTSA